MHDNVDDEPSAFGGNIGILAFQVTDRQLDTVDGCLPDVTAAMDRPVNGGKTQTGLEGDFFERKAMCHMLF